jgi:NADPH:quinone reductase-like Zn-dependent oxidoreductase
VRVHPASFIHNELDWSETWTDRAGRDRTPSGPGHDLSGVVAELGYGTTGLSVGQRVFGLTDWSRNGSLAEYTSVEARNLAPLPIDIDHTVAAALPISGLTAWQRLFDHAASPLDNRFGSSIATSRHASCTECDQMTHEFGLAVGVGFIEDMP